VLPEQALAQGLAQVPVLALGLALELEPELGLALAPVRVLELVPAPGLVPAQHSQQPLTRSPVPLP